MEMAMKSSRRPLRS
uniref:Uncharacterized protein n=1 Tax=Arundo donax TaxID=35708 RepID=A0A0A9GTT5_ARUDO